jgi:hypothetical protein
MRSVNKRSQQVLSPELIQRLHTFATALRSSAEGSHPGAGGFKSATAGEVTFDASEAAVYRVRETKGALSNLLNEASDGKVVLVGAGRGKTVAIISTDTLADVIAAIEEISNLTLAAAIDSLPFPPGSQNWNAPQGHPPTRGISRVMSKH